LWQNLRQKNRKSYFGPLANFGNEQQNNVHPSNIALIKCKKLDIFGNKVFVHDNDRLYSVADPAMGGQGGRPPPIDQNLGLVMAARLRHGGKFSLKSLTFGHFFV